MARMTMTVKDALSLAARAKDVRALQALRDAPATRDEPRRKYANQPITDADGTRWDSKAEHRRGVYLAALERAGEIHNLRRQVRYELIPAQERPSGGRERATHYLADFVYERGGATIVEDVKGATTPEYRLKRKLMLWRHGVEVQEIRS